MSNHKEIYKKHTTAPRDNKNAQKDSRSSPSKTQKSSPSKNNLRIKSPTKSNSPHKFINHVSSSNFSPSRYSDSNTSLTSNNSPSKSEQICNRINLAQQTRKTEKLQNELETVLMRVELHQSKFYTTFNYSSDEDFSDSENSPLKNSETTKSSKTKKSAEQTKELTDEYIAKFFHNSAQLMKILYQILDSNEYALIDENDELVQVPDAESESKEKQQRRDSYRNNITDLNKLESQLAKLKKLGDDLLTRAANSTGTKAKGKSKKLSEELQKFWKAVEKFSEKTSEKSGKKVEKADKSENIQDYPIPDDFLEKNSNLILDECMRFCEDVSETHGYKFKKNAGSMANKLLPSCKRLFLHNIQTVNENEKLIEQLKTDLKISDSKNRKLENSLTEIQRSWKQDKAELFQKTVENDILKGKLSDGYSEISDLKSEIMNLQECIELNEGGGDDSGLRSQLEEIENRRVLEREDFMAELKAKENEFDEFRDRMEKVLSEQEVEIVEIKEGTGLELIERTKVIDTLKSKILELEKFIPDGLRAGTTLLKTVCTSIDSILKLDSREDISEKATSVQSFFELINMSKKNSKDISRQTSSLDQLLSGLSSQDIPNGWSFGKYKSEMEGKMSEQGAMIELLERIYSQYSALRTIFLSI